MSYDIDLTDPVTHKVLHLEHKHQITGGTYQVGGTKKCRLNITYNYANHFVKVLGKRGIRIIYGMTGAQSIPVLENAANKLNNDVSDDYWESTEGNAKRSIKQLIALAQLRPDGVWEGD